MDDLLERPRTLRILRALRLEGVVNQRRFTLLAQTTPHHAQDLRRWMETRGLLRVDATASARIHGANATDVDVRLTAEAERIADKLLEVDALYDLARKQVRSEDDA